MLPYLIAFGLAFHKAPIFRGEYRSFITLYPSPEVMGALLTTKRPAGISLSLTYPGFSEMKPG